MVTLRIFCLVGLFVVGCAHYDENPLDEVYAHYDKNPLDEVRGFYETPHQLRKMFVADQEVTVREPGRGNISGGFFLFIGEMDGQYKEGTTTRYQVTYVRFAWEIEDHTYIITTLPLEKIRVKLVDQTDIPTVSFFLNKLKITEEFRGLQVGVVTYEGRKQRVEYNLGRVLRNYYNPHEALARYLDYVVFRVRDKDWPKNINMLTGGFDR